MKIIEEKGIQFSIGEGYYGKIIELHGREWLLGQIKEIARLLIRVGSAAEVSIVFDPQLKNKTAWWKEDKKKSRLLINLALRGGGTALAEALRDMGIEVFSPEEVEKMAEKLPQLRKRALQGKDGEGEKAEQEYSKLLALVNRFSR